MQREQKKLEARRRGQGGGIRWNLLNKNNTQWLMEMKPIALHAN